MLIDQAQGLGAARQWDMLDKLLYLIEQVEKKEREACAKVCDVAANNSFSSSGVVWGEKLAREIRAMGDE